MVRRKVLLSTFASAASAFVLPDGAKPLTPPPVTFTEADVAANQHFAAGESTPRKSLNWGPAVELRKASRDQPTPVLLLFNELGYKALSGDIASACQTGLASLANAQDAAPTERQMGDCVGKELAAAFLHLLHPRKQFTQTSGHTSTHTNVYHGHFVESINGIPIANGNVNVNVDLVTGEVLSYGDSTQGITSTPADLAESNESFGRKLENWKAKVASWSVAATEQAGQIVLGGSSGSVSSYESPPFAGHDQPQVLKAADASDPRKALLTFLALQAPTPELTYALLADPKATPDQFRLRAIDASDSQKAHGKYEIDDVPSAVSPVKASLAYVHVPANEEGTSSELLLTWKYELETADNFYEAYLAADKSIAARNEEPIQVIDWMRDFRPTGGELDADAYRDFDAAVFAASDARDEQVAALFKGPTKLFARPSSYTTKLRAKMMQRGAVEAMRPVEDGTNAEVLKTASPAYRVFPWGVNAPDEGKRETLTGTSIELDDQASPAGWHTVPSASKGGKARNYLDTRGNNAVCQDNPDGGNSFENNYRPSGGSNMTFDFKLGWPKAGHSLDPRTYINASITELFYTNNEIHDLFYRYGFDEASGNFQEYNFGRGGAGGDAVQANAQDGSGMNNANFATPPDGQRPRMRMYAWSGTQPYRDGDFEAGIVIHEYAHGISTRLTGGSANSGCLGWGEAGGMGEGWGDFFATLIREHSRNVTEYSMGEWASGRAGGIRNYVYSRNLTTNPNTYKTLDKPGYWGVHAIGEVWAEMLFEMSENLIEKHGFQSGGLFPPAAKSAADGDFYNKAYKGKRVPKAGNTLALQLVVDALKLQPCRPSFQDARDAILQADSILTGGDNACEIWAAFSKRGLGAQATLVGGTPWGGGIRTEDYKLPAKCTKKKTVSF